MATLTALATEPARLASAAGPRDADRAPVLEELEACLRDEAALLEDTRALIDWLRRRRRAFRSGVRSSATAASVEERRAAHRRHVIQIASGIAGSLQLHAQLVQKAHAMRREALGRLVSRPPALVNDRSAIDTLRVELADMLQSLDRTLREHCRRTLASESGVQARMATEVARIGDDDLAREVTRQAISLSLRRESLSDLQRAMRDLVEQDLRSMAEETSTVMADVEILVQRTLRDEFGAAAGPMPRWEIADLIERVADAMQFSLRYRGTLPRRGFVQRLAEGRKSVFTVLMFISLFGSFVGFNWRTHPALGWLFMGGFLFAVARTFRSWNEDERERLDEELEKARELLRMEARRLLGEVYRELQAALADVVEGMRRSVITLVEEAARAAGVRNAREAQVQRDTAHAALRELDASDVAFAAWRQRLARVETEAHRLASRGLA